MPIKGNLNETLKEKKKLESRNIPCDSGTIITFVRFMLVLNNSYRERQSLVLTRLAAGAQALVEMYFDF